MAMSSYSARRHWLQAFACVVGTLCSMLAPSFVHADDYYVAPAGSDAAAADGSLAKPFASIGHAQSVVKPGDRVYFRDGVYAPTSGTAPCTGTSGVISVALLDKSGSAGAPISYLAYAGEHPVFDFASVHDNCRITGFRVTGSYLVFVGLTLRNVPQNNDLNHESWGIWVSGSHNRFEQLDLHHHMGPGLFIQNGSDNLVLNCDSHDNYDPMSSSGPGTNADGFGCHVDASGTGNVFRGCRAWFNADDGFDLIQAKAPVVIESSWAFDNGYRSGTTTASGGDGNGFKGGGYGLPPTNVPALPPSHTIRQCVAFQNRASGFYANHHPVANHWDSDSAFANHAANFNMLGYASGAAINVGVLRNDLAFMGTAISNGSGVDDQFNSWDGALGVSVEAADFQSTSTTGWDGPRQADGSLPVLTSLHLATGSDLIDRGMDIGLPFNDLAPDLGAFETGPPPIMHVDGGMGTAGGPAADGGGLDAGAAAAGAGGSNAGAGTAGSAGAAGGAAGTGGAAGGTSGAAGAGAGAAAVSGGTSGTSDTAGTSASNTSSSGCGCRVVAGRSNSTSWLWLTPWLVLVYARRRREQRRA